MQALSLAQDYLFWHYTSAYLDIIAITRNYLWFVNHLFSVSEVFRSLFAPFKRLKEERVNIVRNPGGFFANLTVNIIMRIVGLVVRSALLVIALSSLLLVLTLGVFTIVLWTGLPFLVVYFFMSGFAYLFS